MALVRKNPEPQDAIIFAGSSIFHFWETLEQDMAPMPVINQAFPGARIHSVLNAMDKLIIPYNPRIVVFYCGSNDINDGAGQSHILNGFKTFVERVRDNRPDTPVYFTSINKAPQKIDRWNVIDVANNTVRHYCEETPGLGYIDVNPELFDAGGEPLTELYRDDGLHFKPDSYALFARIIKPVIEEAWKRAGG